LLARLILVGAHPNTAKSMMEPAAGPEGRLVSAGILTYNMAWSLPSVLEAVLRIRYDLKLVRIIIVDNESTDGTRRIIEEFIKTHGARFERVVFVVKQTGIPEARNICIREAAGSDYLFFLDSDVVPGPEAIDRLLAFFEARRDVGIACLPYDSENSRGKFWVLVNAFKTPEGPAEANKVGTGCTLFSMAMIGKVGFFNERLRVLEDGEYCYRARRLGYKIICDFGYPARHLKRIQMDPGSYLGFVRDSAAFYVEMAVGGSRIYLARLLLSAFILASFVTLLVWPTLPVAVAMMGLVVAALAVNSSNRLWGDGSTIKASYRPIVGVVFSVATLVITLGSVLAVYRRVAGPRPSRRRATEERETETERIQALVLGAGSSNSRPLL